MTVARCVGDAKRAKDEWSCLNHQLLPDPDPSNMTCIMLFGASCDLNQFSFGGFPCLFAVCSQDTMDVVGMWRAEVQEAREHDARVAEDLFEAFTDDDELPSGSEMSDGSDDSEHFKHSN